MSAEELMLVGGCLVCSLRMCLQICDSQIGKKMVSLCSAGRLEIFFQSDSPHLFWAGPPISYKAAREENCLINELRNIAIVQGVYTGLSFSGRLAISADELPLWLATGFDGRIPVWRLLYDPKICDKGKTLIQTSTRL